ncbi:MAG: shikimate kinase [Patescibacteria group bacterium]|nr:shikimate kinase [Patescibacteria group bacterium]
MSKNIVITGMRGTGKSRIGRKIAETLEKEFVDLDEEIENHEGISTAEIVGSKGWDYFRAVEKQMVEKFSKKKGLVISTGGGAIIDQENEKNLRENGFVIFLRCDIQKLAERIKHSKNRPSLTEKNFVMEFKDVWEDRKKRYLESADLVFDVDKESEDKERDIETKANIILKLLPDDCS